MKKVGIRRQQGIFPEGKIPSDVTYSIGGIVGVVGGGQKFSFKRKKSHCQGEKGGLKAQILITVTSTDGGKTKGLNQSVAQNRSQQGDREEK